MQLTWRQRQIISPKEERVKINETDILNIQLKKLEQQNNPKKEGRK